MSEVASIRTSGAPTIQQGDEALLVNHFPYRVRYADTDTMTFMYNGEYLRLFEIGRTELLREAGLPYSELEKSGFSMPVLEAHVWYRNPSFYDDMLDIETTFRAEAGPTIRLHYRILREAMLIAEGYTVHCFMNTTTRKAVRPPRRFLDAVQQGTAEGRAIAKETP